jgi:hypothetical protein
VILAQTTVVWRAAVRRHDAYEHRFADRYRLVHFEDLVAKPDETLSAVYEFLGVEMPAGATDVDVVSSGYKLGEHGLDPGAATRWRDQIGAFSRRWLELALRRPMRRAGYSRS